MRYRFFIILAVVFLAAPILVLAATKYSVYADANITLKYPQWKKVDVSKSPAKDNILVAVANGGCSFALMTEKVPAETNLKNFVTAKVADQIKTVSVKFSKKVIKDNYFDIEAVVKLDKKNTIKQYAYGGLASNHSVYQIMFAGTEKDYNRTCKPQINAVVKSIKWLESLSEQPNKTVFSQYFTNIFIARLPVGAEFNPGKIIKTKIFKVGDQFCTSMDMKKQIPANTLSSAVYDVNTKQDVAPRGAPFPQALGPKLGESKGNSIGCEPLERTVGKYEYKIYVNNDLVAVLPFEVK